MEREKRRKTGESGTRSLGLRTAACGGMLLSMLLLRHFRPSEWERIGPLVCSGPPTAMEAATRAMAQALREGRGWYIGFAAFVSGLLYPG